MERRVLLSGAVAGVELFSASPALFVENQGQWADESIRYAHNGSGANVWMTDAGAVFQLHQREAATAVEEQTPVDPLALPRQEHAGESEGIIRSIQFSAGFVGTDGVRPIGLNHAETQFNYFVGDEASWRSNVPGYELVAYEGLYAGIDLHAWGQRGSLKYEFHVAPGVDYQQIQIRYEGIEGLSIAEDGTLRVRPGEGWAELVDDAPYIYQEIDGQRVEVAGRFVLADGFTYSFELLGEYDPGRVLVIDPELAWMTYLGGSGYDDGNAIALDGAGNAFVTGRTWSANFAGANNTYKGGYDDAFVAKVSRTGTLLWMTYLGESADDQGHGIAVDGAGNAFVTGWTESRNFPGANNTYNGGLRDAFVAKLSPTGILSWASYLGGNGTDAGADIVVDDAGNALLMGRTDSIDFAGANSTYKGDGDVFVAKVSATGALNWMTYLGGSGSDYGYGIAVDGAGNALVTGWTTSFNFAEASNTFRGGNDAFVAKVSAAGTLSWMIYLGGSRSDYGHGIAVDGAGNAFVTGETWSTDFAGANNTYKGTWPPLDAFVAKVSAAGVLDWMTYLGGSRSDDGLGIAVDNAGNAWVTGDTNSTDFTGANNTYKGGGEDAFAAQVSATGTLSWMTYLGGRSRDIGHDIAVDGAGNAFVTGWTESRNFTGANNTYMGGGADVFVLRIGNAEIPVTIIADPNLDAAIREALQKPAGALTYADLQSLTELDAAGRGIADLTGLHYAINLQWLNLLDNPLDLTVGSDAMAVIHTLLSWGVEVRYTRQPVLFVSDDSGDSTDRSIQLPETALNTSSSPRTFTLRNTGGAPLALTQLAVGGEDADDFEVSVYDSTGVAVSLGSFEIPTWSAYRVEVRLRPASTGSKRAQITFNTNDTNNSSVTLTMQGLAAAPVTIADANLEAAIRDALGKPSGLIGDSDLRSLSSLYASGRGIANLSGLEHASNLQTLDLSGNQISDLAPLAGLAKLSHLDVRVNYLDLTPGSPAMEVIDTLTGRGASVDCQPQCTLRFGMPLALLADNGTHAVATADLNGDGRADLAIANSEDNTVSLFLGSADRQFQAGPILSVAAAPFNIVAGDFNGDGYADLAALCADDMITTLLGQADGGFTRHDLNGTWNTGDGGWGFFHIFACDMNLDGYDDLISGSPYEVWPDGESIIRYGSADGLTAMTRQVPGAEAIADMNGDGRPDLIGGFGSSYDCQVRVFLGQSDGTYSFGQAFDVSNWRWPLTVGDFNGDGHMDVITPTDDALTLLYGNGDGTLQQAVYLGTGTTIGGRIGTVGDFDGDGQDDILFSGSSLIDDFWGGEQFGILFGKDMVAVEDPWLPPRAPIELLDGLYTISADFDGDGHPDLARASEEGAVVLFNRRNTVPIVSGDDRDTVYTVQFDDAAGRVRVFVSTSASGTPALEIDRAEFTSLIIEGGTGTDTLVVIGGAEQSLVATDGQVTIGGAVITLNGIDKQAFSFASLTIDANTQISLAPGGDRVLKLENLSLAPGATLDLADNTLIMPALDSAAAQAMAAQINQSLALGRNSGTLGLWTGPDGITSCLAAASHRGMELGIGIVGNDVIVKYTESGDIDLNGSIDGDDYFLIDSGFLHGHDGWQWGDINYDGRIDHQDFFLIDRSFLVQGDMATGDNVFAVSKPIEQLALGEAFVMTSSGPVPGSAAPAAIAECEMRAIFPRQEAALASSGCPVRMEWRSAVRPVFGINAEPAWFGEVLEEPFERVH